MKEIEKLQRRIHWGECVQLALMTLLLAFPIILTFQSDDRRTQLLYALGTVIPVQLIRFFCERFEKKPIRLLLSVIVTVLSVLLTWDKERWSVYLICCIPILISGVFLPRSKGRILLTVPSPYAAVGLLVAYAYGKSVETFGVPYVANLTLVLTALMTVNYFIYVSQYRLLRDLRSSPSAEVSVTGLIRQNRKTVFAFLLIGFLVLSTIPFLLQAKPPEPLQLSETEEETAAIAVASDKEPDDKIYSPSGEGKALDLELAKDILLWIEILVPAVTVVLSLAKAVQILLCKIKPRKKEAETKLVDGMTVERLDEDRPDRTQEKLTGYEKKLRRRYEKLIRSRTPKEASLSALTPTELERAAGLSGPGLETVHDLYRKTRYSPEPADKERYTAFKEALHRLNET